VTTALGRIDPLRQEAVLDPVAAWLLKRQPHLDCVSQPVEHLSAIRATTRVIDALLLDEIEGATKQGVTLSYCALGAGLDARWYRLGEQLMGLVGHYWEIDLPGVLGPKGDLLQNSPFLNAWTPVVARPAAIADWGADIVSKQPLLIVCDNLAERVRDEGFEPLLQGLRSRFSRVRWILGLPARKAGEPWSCSEFERCGWRVENEITLGKRPPVKAYGQFVLVPGVEAARVVVLSAG